VSWHYLLLRNYVTMWYLQGKKTGNKLVPYILVIHTWPNEILKNYIREISRRRYSGIPPPPPTPQQNLQYIVPWVTLCKCAFSLSQRFVYLSANIYSFCLYTQWLRSLSSKNVFFLPTFCIFMWLFTSVTLKICYLLQNVGQYVQLSIADFLIEKKSFYCLYW
jgi:hypothetical protein